MPVRRVNILKQVGRVVNIAYQESIQSKTKTILPCLIRYRLVATRVQQESIVPKLGQQISPHVKIAVLENTLLQLEVIQIPYAIYARQENLMQLKAQVR